MIPFAWCSVKCKPPGPKVESEEEVDLKGAARRNFGGDRTVLYQLWWEISDFMHLSTLIDLYTNNREFDCLDAESKFRKHTKNRTLVHFIA